MGNEIYEDVVQVSSYECDFNRLWKPAAFFQHMTEAAVLHAARLGVGFETLAAQNLFWVHARMKIKFFSFPRVGNKVIIRTWPKTVQQRLFYIRDFEALDASGKRIAAATSAWLVVDATTRRMVTPQALNLALPSLTDHIGLDEPLEKIGLMGDGEEQLRRLAGYSAVDMLGHVNNSRYVEWMCDLFPLNYYRSHTLDWMQINYDHEILPGEEAALLVKQSAQDPALWWVEGSNRTKDKRAFEAVLHWRE